MIRLPTGGKGGRSESSYFDKYQHLRITRYDQGILLAEMHTNGGPIRSDATDHEQFVDAFYEIGRDWANKVVIPTGVVDFQLRRVISEAWSGGRSPGNATYQVIRRCTARVVTLPRRK
jgi:hypothetical protein